MASDVDIANLALSFVGAKADLVTLDPPEKTVEATNIARFYPIVRDGLLQSFEWGFAKKVIHLAQLLSPNTDNSTFIFARPNDALKIIKLIDPDQPTRFIEFRTALDLSNTKIILTNIEAPDINYVARIEDTSLYPPLFVIGLAWALAASIAGPIVRDGEGRTVAGTCAKTSAYYIELAKETSSSEYRSSSMLSSSSRGYEKTFRESRNA